MKSKEEFMEHLDGGFEMSTQFEKSLIEVLCDIRDELKMIDNNMDLISGSLGQWVKRSTIQ